MRGRIAVLLVLGILSSAELLAEQTTSSTLRVSARVEAICEVTAADVDFGTYAGQGGSPLLGTVRVQTTCSPGMGYHIGLNAVTSSGATIDQRRTAPDYQFYSDSQRKTIWGNTPGINTVMGVGTGQTRDHTLFGSVPESEVIPAGPNRDTISVRVYF
jgi:spore coat protein U-like protein